MLKRFGIVLILSFISVLSFTTSASALVNYGNVSGWMASTSVSKIGFFSASDIKLYITKNSNWLMTDTNFSTYITHAIDSWHSVVNKTTSTGTSSNFVKSFNGIGRSDANSLSIPSNVLGLNTWTASTYYGYGKAYGTHNFDVYTIQKSVTYLIWSTSGAGKTSDFTANQWKNVFAHEYGHGLGYYGHSANSTKDLMWEDTSSYSDWGTISPTQYDKGHMGIVY
ncbi:hypothetical protein ACFOQM_06430 [Paenibacillus sp. GCM10012307]|uniref:Uncharacterized protein n=1 Tax=Paenibacillus roseus TaxID=2798579 RepID=A0A934J522_9BACL|nr:hypothetical protein [Paenibacillus roseus]MBJ6360936.1 hypothetical protein [Paenibacillus roseus]